MRGSASLNCGVPAFTPTSTFFPRTEQQFDELRRHNRAVGLSCLKADAALTRNLDTVSVARDHEALRIALGVAPGELAGHLLRQPARRQLRGALSAPKPRDGLRRGAGTHRRRGDHAGRGDQHGRDRVQPVRGLVRHRADLRPARAGRGRGVRPAGRQRRPPSDPGRGRAAPGDRRGHPDGHAQQAHPEGAVDLRSGHLLGRRCPAPCRQRSRATPRRSRCRS